MADIPAYLKAGIRVGMGVDGEASADLADPFENMRSGLYAVRDKYENATVMSPYDVLRLHTMGSADVMGVADKLGSLEKGKYADFLVIDPTRFRTVFDPYASLVFVAGERDLERVYLGGDLLVHNGELVKQDMVKERAEVSRRVAAMRLKTFVQMAAASARHGSDGRQRPPTIQDGGFSHAISLTALQQRSRLVTAFAGRTATRNGSLHGLHRSPDRGRRDEGWRIACNPTTTATTVRITNGKTQVLDGPYIDSKEQLGGYYVIDLPDLDAALSWAARCPGAGHGVVEVRPIWPSQAAVGEQATLEAARP